MFALPGPHRTRPPTPLLALALALACACAGPGAGATPSTASAGPSSGEATAAATDGVSSTGAATTDDPTATTTTTTTATTATSASTGTTAPPDLGPIACDPFDDGCPEGEKCTFWADDGGGSWNATRCVPIDPDPAAVGEPCKAVESGASGLDNCAQGAMCWDVDPETLEGRCVALCTGSSQQCWEDPASCCPPGHSCRQSRSGYLAVCIQDCDPVAQDCASEGDGCYPAGDLFQCVPDVSGDKGAVGEPCEFINVCDPGLFCGNADVFPGCDPMTFGCCVPFCDLQAPACPQGTACAPWWDDPNEAPEHYKHVGACVIPA